jgi:hypothetical protein
MDRENYLVKAYKVKMKFIFTPLFYSIGNAAEEILWAQAYAVKNFLELNIVKPGKWTESLGYQICNKELFNLGFSNTKNSSNNILINIITNYIFFFKRLFHLFIKKINRKGLKDNWQFPRIGLNKIWPPYYENQYSLDMYKNNPIINLYDISHINFQESCRV